MSSIVKQIIISGSGLSPEQKEVVDRFRYNEKDDILISSSSIQTKPSSYLLGNIFRISNGVFAVSFKLGDGQDSIGLNTIYDENGTISPKYYHFGSRQDLVVNSEGGVTLPRDFELNYTTFGDNLTYDFKVKPLEAGKLNVKFWLGTDNTGNLIFDEIRTIEEAEIGNIINFNVGNKYILPKNTDIHVQFEGVQLEGGEVTNTESPFFGQTLPIFTSEVQAYKKVSLVNHSEIVSDDIDIEYPADYVVDTSEKEITMTVPESFKDSFTVYDAKSKFRQNSCKVDFGDFNQGVATLSSRNDSFKFFYDSTEEKWFYIDLNAKRGGEV